MSAETMIVEEAAETTTYIELTRKERTARPPVLISWIDHPVIFGEDGYTAELSFDDQNTLIYLYGKDRLKMDRIGLGDRFRVTLRPEMMTD